MRTEAAEFFASDTPLLLRTGDARRVLPRFPEACIDCCLTSPPYWGQRDYAGGGIGRESRPEAYVEALLGTFAEVARVLKPEGSLWLNLGDAYRKKRLLGLPWRVALALGDEQGWILRNAVVWNKLKGGPDTARDRLRRHHEMLFHFVRQPEYHYDLDAIRNAPRQTRVVGGAVVSATGVTGVRYRRQIELSTALDDAEKAAAVAALERELAAVKEGRLADFRMVLRGRQRATHSDRDSVSGRARELRDKGFYVLRYHPKGSKPGDVWEILPEDTQGRGSGGKGHFAAFPEDLCRTPVLATCPPGGVLLDPFCGTGTALKVARDLGRRAVGIDISRDYVAQARRRLKA